MFCSKFSRVHIFYNKDSSGLVTESMWRWTIVDNQIKKLKSEDLILE